MMNLVLIGIGAGAAAALLFASVISGALLSIPLFYLAPLPIMIAGLGWSHWAALIAAGIGSISLGLALGTVFFFGFLADAGIPAWWLGYLAMLARPLAAAGNGHEQPPLEWYPPGRIVMWAALLAAMVVIVAIPNFGTDAQTFVTSLHDALTRMLRAQLNAPDGPLKLPGGTDPERFINFMVAVMPPTAAILAMLTSLLNLWLAGRVVKFSGRLTRPWPDLTAMRAPPLLAIALAAAIALSFFDGLLGIVAQVVCASLLMAYAVLGFSVLHAVTRGWNGRPFVLAGTYLAMLVVSWLILAVCLLGLIDTVIDVRALVARKTSPPTPS